MFIFFGKFYWMRIVFVSIAYILLFTGIVILTVVAFGTDCYKDSCFEMIGAVRAKIDSFEKDVMG